MDQQTHTSGFAIASLVLGIVSLIINPLCLLAIPFGIVGIVNTGKPGTKGRGMAIAGLVIGAVALVLWVAALIFLSSIGFFLL